MPYFAALITYVPDAAERRAPYRPAHLAYLRDLHAAGKVIMAGAWSDPLDGALIIYHTESRAEAEQLLQNDPYAQAGLWTSLRLREWNVVIPPLDEPEG
ncbi:MAG: YciI family protein [Chloroflexi bacterium]|nr:YciI family protein [Chloroflexota bacterium]GIW09116.1 MAG: hypothetical protein KatS3mg061_0173 [Dehalococcoidia bacterium]